MPDNGKKTILLLCDDIRMNSGIATMGRELILSTAHKYNFINLGGAITHPEKGKVFDLSQSVNEQKKIKDAYVKVIPTDGYGNEQSLFQLIAAEKPNAILHFTDPRFWGWLYALEHQIRGSGIPLCYLAIWDDIPYPMYNRPFYESCDAIFGISKQSNNIHKMVLEPKNCCTITGGFHSDGTEFEWTEVRSDKVELDVNNLEWTIVKLVEDVFSKIPDGSISPDGTILTPEIKQSAIKSIIRQLLDKLDKKQLLNDIEKKKLDMQAKELADQQISKWSSPVDGSSKITGN